MAFVRPSVSSTTQEIVNSLTATTCLIIGLEFTFHAPLDGHAPIECQVRLEPFIGTLFRIPVTSVRLNPSIIRYSMLLMTLLCRMDLFFFVVGLFHGRCCISYFTQYVPPLIAIVFKLFGRIS